MLYNLREAAGESQQDVADALNLLALKHDKTASVTANQVSRWERGITRPQPFYRRLVAEHFGVPLHELGLTRPRVVPKQSGASLMEDEVLAISTEVEEATDA